MKNGFAIMITKLAIMKKEGSYDEKKATYNEKEDFL